MRIFISYRRDDAAGEAGRLADHLYRRFGADRVFLDIDTIEPGRDFVEVLEASLQQTAVLLVVIGRQWTTVTGTDGVRRLEAPGDYVRLEIETALARGIPVVPVLVQGAAMPTARDLPSSLEAFARRHAFSLDHGEFHADAERLGGRLAGMLGASGDRRWWERLPRWWPAAAVVVLLAAAIGSWALWRGGPDAGAPGTDDVDAQTQALLLEASAQRRREQYTEAIATLARARERAPESPAVREAHEDAAMDWIRNVRIEGDDATFGDAIKPGLAVVDAAVATAQGMRRADLLAHAGWASFLLWRDGKRTLDPEEWYRDALAVDAANPYANAMLAHWILFRGDDVARAEALFTTALSTGRAKDVVRDFQWAAYANSTTLEADAARIRVADSMRRAGQRLTGRQPGLMWSPFFFALSRPHARAPLLEALPPDEYLETLAWVFDDYFEKDDSRRETLRFYRALLDARAGRREAAVAELRALRQGLADGPGTLRNAVDEELKDIDAPPR